MGVMALDSLRISSFVPTALILSGALMLDHLGEKDAARRVRDAVHKVIKQGKALTSDLGGTASTSEFALAVAKAV